MGQIVEKCQRCYGYQQARNKLIRKALKITHAAVAHLEKNSVEFNTLWNQTFIAQMDRLWAEERG
jgi:hypothetical protein